MASSLDVTKSDIDQPRKKGVGGSMSRPPLATVVVVCPSCFHEFRCGRTACRG